MCSVCVAQIAYPPMPQTRCNADLRLFAAHPAGVLYSLSAARRRPVLSRGQVWWPGCRPIIVKSTSLSERWARSQRARLFLCWRHTGAERKKESLSSLGTNERSSFCWNSILRPSLFWWLIILLHQESKELGDFGPVFITVLNFYSSWAMELLPNFDFELT